MMIITTKTRRKREKVSEQSSKQANPMNDTNHANKQGKPVVVVVKGWDWKGPSRAYHGEKKTQ